MAIPGHAIQPQTFCFSCFLHFHKLESLKHTLLANLSAYHHCTFTLCILPAVVDDSLPVKQPRTCHQNKVYEVFSLILKSCRYNLVLFLARSNKHAMVAMHVY